jgi:uncharacterized damage-inducible protein DinB
VEIAPEVRFERRWHFVRGLTLSLLNTLDDDDLTFTPGTGLGALGLQFRHLGRIQCNYIVALRTKRMEFGAPHLEATDLSVAGLRTYLHQADSELSGVIEDLAWDSTVDWFGENVDAEEHLHRMTQHETLHHGQLIVYVTVLGRRFPMPWSAYGL